MKNTVADILKFYSIINVVAGIIVSLILGGQFIFAGIVACIVSSFLIYAAGEVIQLLQDIKDNTSVKSTKDDCVDSDELPLI